MAWTGTIAYGGWIDRNIGAIREELMSKTTKEVKLGELLSVLGMINEQQLADTVKLALQVGLPLGRALVLAGHLSEAKLKIALDFQSLMKTNEIEPDVVRKAYTHMTTEGLNMLEALARAGWNQKADKSGAHTSKLGGLLLDAKIINQQQLEEAQTASYETNLPLGRILGLMGKITHPILTKALELQTAVRESRISYEEAVRRLNPIEVAPPPMMQSGTHPRLDEQQQVSKKKTIRLGELLMLSGILTEADIMNALELSFSRHQSMGDILVELGLITQSLLNLALELQEAVCDGNLNVHAATDTLHHAATTGSVTTDTVSGFKVAKESMRLGDLLKMSGFVDNDDLDRAMELSTRFPSLIGKMLVVSGAIDEAILLSALRCQFLLRNDLLSTDDAVSAMQYAERNHLSLDDALEELGLRVPETLRRDLDTAAANQ